MPGTCCVPGCKSNYRSTMKSGSVSCFSFPKDEARRLKWLSAIGRKNMEITKYSVVCAKHFSDSHIKRADTLTFPDGSPLLVPRKYPKLTENAYPTIFPEPTMNPIKRELKETTKYKLSQTNQCNRNLLELVEYHNHAEIMSKPDSSPLSDNQDKIGSFETFCVAFESRNLFDFRFEVKNDRFVLFYKINMEGDFPNVEKALKIFKSFKINVYYDKFDNKCVLPASNFEWILGEELLCDTWSKFENLLLNISSLGVSFYIET